MSYERLLPSMADYSANFGRLDSLDFKIIKAMLVDGVHNSRRLAEQVGAPQQTVNYRVRRFDKDDIVRFRALINEAKLGLKSYSVLASTTVGNEDVSGCALTIFPLWRYLAIVDGWNPGNYVRYTIPPDRERDLKTFLAELAKRHLITDYEIQATSSPRYPLLDMNFYAGKKQTRIFDWQRWIENFDSLVSEESNEIENPRKAEFDLVDLIILRCLELNARTTQRKIVEKTAQILGYKDSKKLIPMISRRIKNDLNPQRLINGYRAYLFPNQEKTALLFLFRVTFANNKNLNRLTEALKNLPYNCSYETIAEAPELYLRMVVPSFEWANMRKAFGQLAERGYIKDVHMLLGDLAHGTWDNVEIHQMFKDGAWNFSYGTAIQLLEDYSRKKSGTP